MAVKFEKMAGNFLEKWPLSLKKKWSGKFKEKKIAAKFEEKKLPSI